MLLDEFEKAHANDLGRLPPGLRRRAPDRPQRPRRRLPALRDRAHVERRLGDRQRARAWASARTRRASTRVDRARRSRAFRPELLNRLDRVVVFRPLGRELMRTLVEHELAAVLERRGFRMHPWAVEWDESAIDFLLEQGFTADLGARPLKRAVEQHLLAPLATTIVERQFPEGEQFLFITARDGRFNVAFVDPDAAEGARVLRGTERQRETLDAHAASRWTPRGAAPQVAVPPERLDQRVERRLAPVGRGEGGRARPARASPAFWERRYEQTPSRPDRVPRPPRRRDGHRRAARRPPLLRARCPLA